MKCYCVRITECTSRDTRIDRATNVRIAETDECGDPRSERELRRAAVDRAVPKLFGKTCFWFADSGLGLHYGQVFRPVSRKYGGGNSSVTCRARADISEI